MAILGFFTEFRITVLARILRKFLKNLHITIFYFCHLELNYVVRMNLLEFSLVLFNYSIL